MKPYGWKPRANAYVGRPDRLERVVSKRVARRGGDACVVASTPVSCRCGHPLVRHEDNDHTGGRCRDCPCLEYAEGEGHE